MDADLTAGERKADRSLRSGNAKSQATRRALLDVKTSGVGCAACSAPLARTAR